MKTGVNQKYVNLLQSTFDKYRLVDKRGQGSATEEKEISIVADNFNNIDVKANIKGNTTQVKSKSRFDKGTTKCKVRGLFEKSIDKYQRPEVSSKSCP